MKKKLLTGALALSLAAGLALPAGAAIRFEIKEEVPEESPRSIVSYYLAPRVTSGTYVEYQTLDDYEWVWEDHYYRLEPDDRLHDGLYFVDYGLKDKAGNVVIPMEYQNFFRQNDIIIAEKTPPYIDDEYGPFEPYVYRYIPTEVAFFDLEGNRLASIPTEVLLGGQWETITVNALGKNALTVECEFLSPVPREAYVFNLDDYTVTRVDPIKYGTNDPSYARYYTYEFQEYRDGAILLSRRNQLASALLGTDGDPILDGMEILRFNKDGTVTYAGDWEGYVDPTLGPYSDKYSRYTGRRKVQTVSLDSLRPTGDPVTGFTDVNTSMPYYEAMKWAVAQGITTGTSPTTFGPWDTCTRAQVVTFLWRQAGSPEPTAANPFRDVPAGSYYEKAVLWAVERGITTGTSADAFSPDAVCTKGEVMTFLWRQAGKPYDPVYEDWKEYNINYGDPGEQTFYEDPVAWGMENGVCTCGLRPTYPCLRGDFVTYLYHYATGTRAPLPPGVAQ